MDETATGRAPIRHCATAASTQALLHVTEPVIVPETAPAIELVIARATVPVTGQVIAAAWVVATWVTAVVCVPRRRRRTKRQHARRRSRRWRFRALLAVGRQHGSRRRRFRPLLAVGWQS